MCAMKVSKEGMVSQKISEGMDGVFQGSGGVLNLTGMVQALEGSSKAIGGITSQPIKSMLPESAGHSDAIVTKGIGGK